MKTFLKVLLGLVILGVILGVLFPAGRNSLAARQSAFRVKGRNVYLKIMEKYEEVSVAKSIRLDCFTNSIAFFNMVYSSEDVSAERQNAVDGRGCLWNVFIDGIDCEDDMCPILVSANFDPLNLVRFGGRERMPIGVSSEVQDPLLDDKAIVVVRRGGSSDVIDAKHLTRDLLLGGSTNLSRKMRVLTQLRMIELPLVPW